MWFLSLFFLLPFSNVLTVQVPLPFHVSFRIILSVSSKNTPGILTGMEINQWFSFWRIERFVILRLPIHEHGMSLKLFRFSFIILSIYQHFVVFSRKILYAVRFRSKYFSLVGAVTSNRTVTASCVLPCACWLCYIRLLVQSWFCCWHVCLFW